MADGGATRAAVGLADGLAPIARPDLGSALSGPCGAAEGVSDDLAVVLAELRELRAVTDELVKHSAGWSSVLARALAKPSVRKFLGL